MREHRHRVAEIRVVRVDVRSRAVLARAEQRVLEVVCEKPEAAVRAGAVASAEPIVCARARGTVGIAHPEIEQEKIYKVVHVEQHRVRSRCDAIRSEAEDFKIVRVGRRGEVRLGLGPKLLPRDQVAVCISRGVSGGLLAFDHVVIVLEAAEVCFAKRRLGALFGIKEAPVNAVDVEVKVPQPPGMPAHVELCLARALLAHEGVRIAVSRREAPRVILRGAEIELVKFLRSTPAKQRVLQLRFPIVPAEEKMEAVLRIIRVAGKTAANPNAAIYLKLITAIRLQRVRRIDPFHRARTFPRETAPTRIRVDALARTDVQQARERHRDAHARQRIERSFHCCGTAKCGICVVHNVRVHSEIEHLRSAARARPAGRRSACGGLRDDVGWKKIRLRVHVGRLKAGLERCRADDRRAGDVDRGRIHRARRRRRRCAIGRVADGRARSERRDRQRERRSENAALHAELRVCDFAEQRVRAVHRAGRR